MAGDVMVLAPAIRKPRRRTRPYDVGDDGTQAALDEVAGAVNGQSADISEMQGYVITFESVSRNLPSEGVAYAYSGGNLTQITYANGIVKTFNYSGDTLVSIVLSGNTPDGIELTKTLTYSGDDLIGAVYS